MVALVPGDGVDAAVRLLIDRGLPAGVRRGGRSRTGRPRVGLSGEHQTESRPAQPPWHQPCHWAALVPRQLFNMPRPCREGQSEGRPDMGAPCEGEADKVARDLKYRTPEFDSASLEREL